MDVASKRTAKHQLTTKIRSLGGSIASEEESDAPPSPLILLANGYYRLGKIFLAIVRGIPIVHVDWLEACKRSNSIVAHEPFIVRIPDLRNGHRIRRPDLLRGWTIILVGGGKKFFATWAPVCSGMKATILSSHRYYNPTRSSSLSKPPAVRIVVEELPSASSQIVRWAHANAIRILTVDWLMQVILSGRVE
jgi:hypothetical protein